MGSDEREKLRTLLHYWIEHNQEHSSEFKEWADKARVWGDDEIAEEILQAAQGMDRTSELLSQSLKRLEEA